VCKWVSLIFANLMDAANFRSEQLLLSSTEMKKVAKHRKYLDTLKFVAVAILLFLFDTYTYLGGSGSDIFDSSRLSFHS
jgi:hypothetical protein